MGRFILFILFSVSLCSNLFGQTRGDSIRQVILDRNTNSILVVAHRGLWGAAPENSILAISNAIEEGVDIIEIDIQRTKDGQLVLMHDETLDRTTTGQGRVDIVTLDSLKKMRLYVGDSITDEQVPTLKEALIVANKKVLFNLDKADRYIDDVYKLLHDEDMANYVIMKSDKPFVDVRVQFHAYLFDAILMPIINLDTKWALTDLDAYSAFLKPPIVEFIFSDASLVSKPNLKSRLRSRSLIWMNTMWDRLSGGYEDEKAIDNPHQVYGYLIDSLGANIIQTDNPKLLLNYLRERKLHN